MVLDLDTPLVAENGDAKKSFQAPAKDVLLEHDTILRSKLRDQKRKAIFEAHQQPQHT